MHGFLSQVKLNNPPMIQLTFHNKLCYPFLLDIPGTKGTSNNTVPNSEDV